MQLKIASGKSAEVKPSCNIRTGSFKDGEILRDTNLDEEAPLRKTKLSKNP